MSNRTVGLAAFVLSVLSVFCANWAIATFGPVPVGFGLYAPAGVYFVGLQFTLRDIVQERLGKLGALGAILLGAAVSYVVSPQFAAASGLTFLVSELIDFAVYTPLRRRSWLAAVVLSNTAGLVVDSALFLSLAFGSLAFLPGQVVGKAWMTALTVVLWSIVRRAQRPVRVEVS